MTTYPTKFQSAALPLPPSVDQSSLQGKGLWVMQGLSNAIAEQLVLCSREPHIVEYCPNDALKRFRDIHTVAAWQSQGRFSLPLIKQTGDESQLAGFGWFGPKAEPHILDSRVTFSFRIYAKALGQGNALPYIQTMLAAHDIMYGNRNIWLEAWSDNQAAIRTYEKAGFIKVAEAPGVRHGKKYTRVFMSLVATSTKTLE